MPVARFNCELRPFRNDGLDELHEKGWKRVPNCFSSEFLTGLWTECLALKSLFYRPELLEAHSVYLSDSTESRVSHAMMVTRGKTPLPHIDINSFRYLSELMQFHEGLLYAHLGTQSVNSRNLLNWQEYLGASKPVPEHFDGEYLRFKKLGEGYALEVEEALLPRYILIVVIANENKSSPEGVVLRERGSQQLISPPSHEGDVLIFDNLRFRHSVPCLPKPRRIVGLRNFDVAASHFIRSRAHRIPSLAYSEIEEGWIAPDADSIHLQREFLDKRWPGVWDQTLRDGAVF